MKIGPESILEFLPTPNSIFVEALRPVLSWSLQLEGKVFDGMEVIPMSHVDMKDKILNPDPRVRRSVVCLYVHGFESLWKFVIQHLVDEA